MSRGVQGKGCQATSAAPTAMGSQWACTQPNFFSESWVQKLGTKSWGLCRLARDAGCMRGVQRGVASGARSEAADVGNGHRGGRHRRWRGSGRFARSTIPTCCQRTRAQRLAGQQRWQRGHSSASAARSAAIGAGNCSERACSRSGDRYRRGTTAASDGSGIGRAAVERRLGKSLSRSVDSLSLRRWQRRQRRR